MSLFFETIKVQNQTIFNIDAHNRRLNQTILKNYHIKLNSLEHIALRKHLQRNDQNFNEILGTIEKPFEKSNMFQRIQLNIDLKDFISPPKDDKLYRCKVIYDKEIKSVDFYPYAPKKIESFKVVYSDINYDFKFVDRSGIDSLFEKRENFDDIIIADTKGKLKDTSIANIALLIDNTWLTPKKPLLYGTARAKLLEDKIIQEEELFVKDIEKIESFAIMNAMIGFKIVKNPKFKF